MANSYPLIVPVYEYTTNDPWRYEYLVDPCFGQGWTRQRIAFFAFDKAHPGAVPVHHFYAKDAPLGRWRSAYSTNPNEPLGSGWEKGEIAFHAFNIQAPGTINVYQFQAANPVRFMYSLHSTFPDPNWPFDKIAFHVFAAMPAP